MKTSTKHLENIRYHKVQSVETSQKFIHTIPMNKTIRNKTKLRNTVQIYAVTLYSLPHNGTFLTSP